MIKLTDGVAIPLCALCGAYSPYGDVCDKCIERMHYGSGKRGVNWSSRRGVPGEGSIDAVVIIAGIIIIGYCLYCVLSPANP